MKVFLATYYWSGRFGTYEEYKFLIVAECESVALGLALEQRQQSTADQWTIEEIDITKQSAIQVHYEGT